MSNAFIDGYAIASAPGDLPPDQIRTRYAVMREQFRHDNTIAPLIPGPGQETSITATSGFLVSLESATVFYTADGTVPTEASASVLMTRAAVEWVPFAEYLTSWVGVIPGQPDGTIVRYRIAGRTRDGQITWAQDGQGFWFRYSQAQGVTLFGYRVMASAGEPEWVRDAVVYQIFVDRFRRSSGPMVHTGNPVAKHGGDLRGIIDALPYLDDLGITCLWLSPIGPSETYHRYDATDAMSVDPLVGDAATLSELTSAAHSRGMRVILDFVPSHLSHRHPAFLAARADKDAPTADWFVFYTWPDDYRSFLECVPSLPSLNTNSQGARDYLIESARFWMRECGIDGFRLDHVIGHGMDFWVEFQTALALENPEVVTIGEATDTGDALRRYAGKLNDILDFPLARALRLTFGTGGWDLGSFDAFLTAYDAFLSDGPGRMTFLDNHDMDRFLFVAGQDKRRLAMALLCLMTLPHAPVIYYGTEIGLSHDVSTDTEGLGDHLVRTDMPWDRSEWDQELRSLVAGMVALRHRCRALRRGHRTTVQLDPTQETLAYTMTLAGFRTITVVFNLSSTTRFVEVPGSRAIYSTGSSPRPSPRGWDVPAMTGAVIDHEESQECS